MQGIIAKYCVYAVSLKNYYISDFCGHHYIIYRRCYITVAFDHFCCCLQINELGTQSFSRLRQTFKGFVIKGPSWDGWPYFVSSMLKGYISEIWNNSFKLCPINIQQVCSLQYHCIDDLFLRVHSHIPPLLWALESFIQSRYSKLKDLGVDTAKQKGSVRGVFPAVE